MPSKNIDSLTGEIKKDTDYLRHIVATFHDYDENYEPDCKCKTKGEFVKNAFNYEKPMTSYLKKKYFKNYGLRL